MERRYDAVVHMVTAAEGAEEFYDLSNEARFENIEEAIARDHALREAYLGHHCHFMVDNSATDFGAKIHKTMNLVKSVIGLPTAKRTFKKFVVEDVKLPENLKFQTAVLKESYLPD